MVLQATSEWRNTVSSGLNEAAWTVANSILIDKVCPTLAGLTLLVELHINGASYALACVRKEVILWTHLANSLKFS